MTFTMLAKPEEVGAISTLRFVFQEQFQMSVGAKVSIKYGFESEYGDNPQCNITYQDLDLWALVEKELEMKYFNKSERLINAELTSNITLRMIGISITCNNHLNPRTTIFQDFPKYYIVLEDSNSTIYLENQAPYNLIAANNTLGSSILLSQQFNELFLFYENHNIQNDIDNHTMIKFIFNGLQNTYITADLRNDPECKISTSYSDQVNVYGMESYNPKMLLVPYNFPIKKNSLLQLQCSNMNPALINAYSVDVLIQKGKTYITNDTYEFATGLTMKIEYNQGNTTVFTDQRTDITQKNLGDKKASSKKKRNPNYYWYLAGICLGAFLLPLLATLVFRYLKRTWIKVRNLHNNNPPNDNQAHQDNSRIQDNNVSGVQLFGGDNQSVDASHEQLQQNVEENKVLQQNDNQELNDEKDQEANAQNKQNIQKRNVSENLAEFIYQIDQDFQKTKGDEEIKVNEANKLNKRLKDDDPQILLGQVRKDAVQDCTTLTGTLHEKFE